MFVLFWTRTTELFDFALIRLYFLEQSHPGRALGSPTLYPLRYS